MAVLGERLLWSDGTEIRSLAVDLTGGEVVLGPGTALLRAARPDRVWVLRPDGRIACIDADDAPDVTVLPRSAVNR